jgi:hypothetical protein
MKIKIKLKRNEIIKTSKAMEKEAQKLLKH